MYSENLNLRFIIVIDFFFYMCYLYNGVLYIFIDKIIVFFNVYDNVNEYFVEI